MDLLSLIVKMEEKLSRQKSVLEEMKKNGDGMACEIECRVIGYGYALDDVKIIMRESFDKMAEHYGQG